MGKKIIRPIKGIDTDSSLNKRGDNTIYMAKNLRLNSSEDLSLGEYTNIKGPNRFIDQLSNEKILKIHKISDNIILFVKRSSDDVIALFKEDIIPTSSSGSLSLDYDNFYWQSSSGSVDVEAKVVSGDFGFNENEEIYVRSYYESEDIQKIYWTTKDQPLRSLNVIFSDRNDPSQFSESDLEIIPSSNLNVPIINFTINGSLNTGKIFYLYSLVNSNGSETNFSEISYGYNITQSPENAANDYSYKGFGIGVDSGKGINLTISSVPSGFNRAIVYSIHYIDDVSLPVVSVVYDNVASASITINDIGTPVREVSAEEFISTIKFLNKNGSLEIQNNRLFIANYEEEMFDIDEFSSDGYWDARSFRYANNGFGRVFDQDLSNFITYSSKSDSALIPTDHDCINLTNDYSRNENLIYRENGVTIGSSGINVDIVQNLHPEVIKPDITQDDHFRWFAEDVSSSNEISGADGYSSYANPNIASKNRTFRIDEVYRLGIQFKDSRERLSYVKWICDYRVSYDSDYELINPIYDFLQVPELRLVNLTFAVSNIPTDPSTGEPFKWRIMYVPITDSDQGVFNGMFSSINKYKSDSRFSSSYINKFLDSGDVFSSDTGKYLSFINPEYCFGNSQNYTHYRLLEYPESFYFPQQGTVRSTKSYYNPKKIYDFRNKLAESTYGIQEVISQFDIEYGQNINELIPLDDTDVLIRRTFAQGTYGTNVNRSDTLANIGRNQILRIDQPSLGNLSPISNDKNFIIWGFAYVNNFIEKYGGLSFEERQNNGYAPLSQFSSNSFEIVWGDSYFGLFEYLRQIADNDSTDIESDEASHPEVLIFPCFSRINLNLRSDDFLSRIYLRDGAHLIHEFSGVYSDPSDINKNGEIFTQETDLYLYNQVYSREYDAQLYFIRPTLSSIINKFRTRIISSANKILGEQSDSFFTNRTDFIYRRRW